MRLSLIALVAYGLSLAQGLAVNSETNSITPEFDGNAAINKIEPVLARANKKLDACSSFKLKRKGKDVKPKKSRKITKKKNKRAELDERTDTPIYMGETDSWDWSAGDTAYSTSFAGCTGLVLYNHASILMAHIDPDDEDDIDAVIDEIVSQARDIGIVGASAKGHLFVHVNMSASKARKIVSRIRRELGITVTVTTYRESTAATARNLVVTKTSTRVTVTFERGAQPPRS
ncbi:hypothetical protein BU24DRAFT_410105 [Aaosphaeria arxii CBS 175.79]|uniref:Uncharacterized protein n=1 Tax=Aaosphaeria arxii CBS 175.79 TaxID=1450172 RepID=A0A6A5XPT3_9PLEO|nr:uncharacterized protein BU24DRAFT_410105 [Aaosphaeria arxii CBS 175.79]KAF2014354.1 hypothetical protein BU24DRAFT_410105 [Aaosphaeria arxii CBS 175.79]